MNNNILDMNNNNNKEKKININEEITINNPIEVVSDLKEKQNNVEEKDETLKYNDEEINDFLYPLALQYDKRTYFQYYISLIKTKHNLIFSFFYDKDYNSRIIKMDLFFIGFASNYTVNALFFNDNTMHNIYVNSGSFDLEYQIPKIVYSSLISFILELLIKLLALSNEQILDFKNNEEKKDIEERKKKLKTKLKIKFLLFFSFSFILLLFFCYYISMFGAVYKNTQYHLLKDTLISFGLSMLYPFVIYLLPGLFRIPALADPNKNKEYLYKFSKILQSL